MRRKLSENGFDAVRGAAGLLRSASSSAPDGVLQKWEWMMQKGHRVNPCNSLLHPAVTEAGIQPAGGRELSVQEAYTPNSKCFGCGPANPYGLHLKSTRVVGGLEGRIFLADKYQAFPGIINGGIVSTILDCHGNWTAAIRLMDQSCLPRPPLTLTASMLVDFKQPTPPSMPLIVRSQVVNVSQAPGIGLTKQSIEVDLWLYQELPNEERLLARATGLFKRQGAAREL